jgi:hypothetical protein
VVELEAITKGHPPARARSAGRHHGMLRRALDWFRGTDMKCESAALERPPYPLPFPSEWACFWDLGYVLAKVRRQSDTINASDLSTDC